MNQLDILLTPVLFLLIYFAFPGIRKDFNKIALLPVKFSFQLLRSIIFMLMGIIVSFIISFWFFSKYL